MTDYWRKKYIVSQENYKEMVKCFYSYLNTVSNILENKSLNHINKIDGLISILPNLIIKVGSLIDEF